MAFRKVQNFDAPIPGQSLTHELGARPWQSPPQFSTIEEAIEFYIPRLTRKGFIGRMLDIIERGVPITALAETITLGGVMQGLHTIDVAVLINPILVEFMEGAAKQADIEYVLGDTDGEDENIDGFILNKAMANIRGSDIFEDDEEPQEPEEDTEENTSMGLMSRRGEE
jgi:hypothetical protein